MKCNHGCFFLCFPGDIISADHIYFNVNINDITLHLSGLCMNSISKLSKVFTIETPNMYTSIESYESVLFGLNMLFVIRLFVSLNQINRKYILSSYIDDKYWLWPMQANYEHQWCHKQNLHINIMRDQTLFGWKILTYCDFINDLNFAKICFWWKNWPNYICCQVLLESFFCHK